MSESELDELMGEVGGPCNVMGMVNMFQEKPRAGHRHCGGGARNDQHGDRGAAEQHHRAPRELRLRPEEL